MNDAVLPVLALVALLVTAWSATATKVLQDFSRRELELYCQRRNRQDRFRDILDNDERVMIGAEILQLVGSVLLVLSVIRWLAPAESAPAGWHMFAAAAVLGVVLLAAAVTWIPWAVVHLWGAPFLFHFWNALRLATRLLWPLTLGVSVVDAFFRRLADRPERDEDEGEAFEDEIRSIVTEGLHDGLLEEDTLEMIEGVIELGDEDVQDIMTPRSNVDALDVSLSWQEALKLVIHAGRTRVPVYDKSLDNIVGVLYVKDLLRELSHKPGRPRTPLKELLRKPWFVPTTKPLDEMLQEFLQTRSHLAIVVDEYRSVAGVVTIEDVLEEIVGEIVDESDKEEDAEVLPLSPSAAEVRGTARLEIVNQRLGVDLPEPDEYDTIAGLVIRQLGTIPKPGDSIHVDEVCITVLEATRRRIDKLRVEWPVASGNASRHG